MGNHTPFSCLPAQTDRDGLMTSRSESWQSSTWTNAARRYAWCSRPRIGVETTRPLLGGSDWGELRELDNPVVPESTELVTRRTKNSLSLVK